MKNEFGGSGKKRPQANLPISNLFLDPENPRLPEESQGKKEVELLSVLYEDFDLEELAFSMAENGYFDEEPLVAIPIDLPKAFKKKTYEELSRDPDYRRFYIDVNTKFIVVEGNRRLATAKILLSKEYRQRLKIKNWPTLSIDIANDLKTLPVIIYSERNEVLPYLGVRHIAGIKKWEPYAKARYIANMVKSGFTIDEIQQQVGDRTNSARKIYFCYKLIEEMEIEFDYNSKEAKDLFSYLLLATGQGAVKEFLGVSKKWEEINLESPIDNNHYKNLKDLFSWLFGEGNNKLPVVKESRDITNKLSPVLRSSESTAYLRQTRDLDDAYERGDGEEALVLKNIRKANISLEKSLGILHRHLIPDVKVELDKCKKTLQIMLEKFK